MDTIGKYEVRSLLGQGAMGEVYRAFDPSLEREVAVKVMTSRLDLDEEHRARFFREASSAGSLQHPNIVTVYELGEDSEGHPFIAMELVEGRDLEELIDERVPLSEAEKADLLRQMCEGLAYAHEHGVVHRDIKPANVRVSDRGLVKIMDFGVAHLSSSTLTRTGMAVGTPCYMAPEVVRGAEVDARADIFSVGATFYEMLTHRRAFQGDNPHAILHSIVTTEPPSTDELGLDVSPTLERILRRSLAKDPEERYPSLEPLLDDLEAYREGRDDPGTEKITARHASGRADGSLAGLPLPRSAAVAAALLVGSGGLLWLLQPFGSGPGPVGSTESNVPAAAAESSVHRADGDPDSPVATGGRTGSPAQDEIVPRAARPSETDGPPEEAGSEELGSGEGGPTPEADGPRAYLAASRQAARLREDARGAGADTLAFEPWSRAESLRAEALASVDANRYEEARTAISDAAVAYDSARLAANAELRRREEAAEAELAAGDDAGGGDVGGGAAAEEGEPEAGADGGADRADGLDRSGAREVVEETLASLQRALEAEDIDALRRTWVSLGQEEIENFRATFRQMEDLDVEIEVQSVEPEDDRVWTSVVTTYRFYNRSAGDEERHSFPQRLQIAQRDGAWVIVSSREPSQ